MFLVAFVNFSLTYVVLLPVGHCYVRLLNENNCSDMELGTLGVLLTWELVITALFNILVVWRRFGMWSKSIVMLQC